MNDGGGVFLWFPLTTQRPRVDLPERERGDRERERE
jgi:hypothetical protein